MVLTYKIEQTCLTDACDFQNTEQTVMAAVTSPKANPRPLTQPGTQSSTQSSSSWAFSADAHGRTVGAERKQFHQLSENHWGINSWPPS